MYDVVYHDERLGSTVLAAGLSRDLATSVARREAKARGAGRMFSCGSEPARTGRLVLIVDSERPDAADQPRRRPTDVASGAAV